MTHPDIKAKEYIVSEVGNLFSRYSAAFETFNSEYKQLAYLKEKGFLIEIEKDIFGEDLRLLNDSKTGRKYFDNISVSGQYISIKVMLKKFLEIPGNFTLLKNHMELLDTTNPRLKKNVIQCSMWKNIKKRFDADKFVVPLTFYYDDFEVGNEIGSHKGKNKIGAVYYTIPSLPQNFLAKLTSIFIAYLFKASDRTTFGVKRVFEHLLDELKYLESEGIVINVDDTEHRILFALVLWIGDNLGVHQLLGFNESFSSNYPCRFCKSHRSEIENNWQINPQLLRDRKNYKEDVDLNNPSRTGVKSECIFNVLKSFHVTENVACDLMHDFFLGVCRYDVALLFYKLINDEILTLEDINCRIRSFHFGPHEKDKPCEIRQSHLDKKNIIMYASEMKTLIYYLPMLIGDLIPIDNIYWKWFLLLRNLIDILLSKSLQIELKYQIDDLVQEYLSQRRGLFPNNNLKPKHHYAIHISEIFTKSGPIVNNWCMPFESKHRQLLLYAKNIKNHENLPLSLAVKYQLSMSSYFMKGKALTDVITYGPTNLRSLTSLEEFRIFQQYLHNEDYTSRVEIIRWLQINSRRYEKSVMLLYENNDLFPQFMEIKYIFRKNEKIFLICKLWDTVRFIEHYHSYSIKISDKWVKYSIDKLIDCAPMKRLINEKCGSCIIYYL